MRVFRENLFERSNVNRDTFHVAPSDTGKAVLIVFTHDTIESQRRVDTTGDDLTRHRAVSLMVRTVDFHECGGLFLGGDDFGGFLREYAMMIALTFLCRSVEFLLIIGA